MSFPLYCIALRFMRCALVLTSQGETAEEIAGLARAMLEKGLRVHINEPGEMQLAHVFKANPVRLS